MGKVCYRCVFIEKEAMNVKYVVVAENVLLIFDTQAVYITCWDVAPLISLAFFLI